MRADNEREYVKYLQPLNSLMWQLSKKKAFEAPYSLKYFLDRATLFLAFQGEKIVGALTLFVLRKPTGNFALIEDVIVDEKHRGLGIGKALTKAAIDAARAAGVEHIDLTSRESREVANHLYPALGFQQRDTNVYRLTFGQGKLFTP